MLILQPVWKYSKSHHAVERRATSLALSKKDPKTARFKDSFDVSEAEKAALVKKLRKRRMLRQRYHFRLYLKCFLNDGAP